MKTSIVIGLQYGDEGKGVLTSFLSKPRDLVVRFNGGHQAGHTVVKNNYRHIFSSFGSGTLNGAHTYWSEYCTFYPKSYYNERKSLTENGHHPVHYINPLAMITTPFDVDYNRESEMVKKHGSVGMGFGATIERNEKTPFKLYAIDLTYPEILSHKLNQIAAYYEVKHPENDIEDFIKYCTNIHLDICSLSDIKNDYEHIIFEGAQGIMLDMDFGYFPNVTRSNTTSKNAMKIIKDNDLPLPNLYYAMRSYLTRHGEGFMPNEEKRFSYEDKTNVIHKYQGKFRQGYHSLSQIKYAINCDCAFSGGNYNKKNLAIICLDQTDMKVLIDGKSISLEHFTSLIPKFKNTFISTSEKANFEKLNQYTPI